MEINMNDLVKRYNEIWDRNADQYPALKNEPYYELGRRMSQDFIERYPELFNGEFMDGPTMQYGDHVLTAKTRNVSEVSLEALFDVPDNAYTFLFETAAVMLKAQMIEAKEKGLTWFPYEIFKVYTANDVEVIDDGQTLHAKRRSNKMMICVKTRYDLAQM